MPDAAEVLAALRPAHLPLSTSLSIGDIALAAALGLALALLVAVLWPRRIPARAGFKRALLSELGQSRILPPEEATLVQARLLRQVAAARGRPGAAELSGEAYAAELDRILRTDFFSRGPGRRLALALYEPPANDDRPAADVAAGLERLLRRMRG